jgi:hypothetical protein
MKIMFRFLSSCEGFLPQGTGFVRASWLFAAVVLTVIFQGISPIQADEPPPAGFPLPSGHQFGLNFDQLSATRERPLFASTRRRPIPPPAPIAKQEEAPPPSPPAEPPTVALLGTVLSLNKTQSFALVRPAQTNKTQHVSVGDEIETWKIAEIGARQIVLSLNDRLVTIKLAGDEPGTKPPVMEARMPSMYPPKGFADSRARRFNPGPPPRP